MLASLIITYYVVYGIVIWCMTNPYPSLPIEEQSRRLSPEEIIQAMNETQ